MYLQSVVASVFFTFLSCVYCRKSRAPCKAAPGTPNWPSISQWMALNDSISGRLLQPSPPGAVCHPDQPTYSATLCSIVQAEFFNVDYYSTLPSASAWPSWNNDSCLPFPQAPCSNEGYPIYVVNATNKDDVKKGVDFARDNNVRLVVKATGHDYLGRITAPNSMTLWVHNIKGVSVSDSFRPIGCGHSIDTPAITFGAGEEMAALNLVASQNNLQFISGGQASVGYNGYATGAGHGALGPTYGMAADNILEMEIVSPGGDILTINECQNRDLFWAMRGGGGSTFGAITSTTIKAFPSTRWLQLFVQFGTLPKSEPFWDAMAYWLSQYVSLAELGIAGYGNLSVNTSVDGQYFGGFSGIFLLPVLSPANTSESLAAGVLPIIDKIQTIWPGLFLSQNSSSEYDDWYDWWLPGNGPDYAGIDIMVGSWLLDAKALTANLTALKVALQGASGDTGVQIDLVSGKGVWNAKPRGGSDAVNPAWRKAVVHITTGVTWAYLDPVEKAMQENLLTNKYIEALRMLAPNSGAYVNEADANEPNFQQAFWGSNYPRLLDIKRRFDSEDVFWCTPCVGNELWEEVGDSLCRV